MRFRQVKAADAASTPSRASFRHSEDKYAGKRATIPERLLTIDEVAEGRCSDIVLEELRRYRPSHESFCGSGIEGPGEKGRPEVAESLQAARERHTTSDVSNHDPIFDFLTTAEAAAECRVSSRTILNWIKAGRLPAVRLGNVYRIARHDLEAFILTSWIGPH